MILKAAAGYVCALFPYVCRLYAAYLHLLQLVCHHLLVGLGQHRPVVRLVVEGAGVLQNEGDVRG